MARHLFTYLAAALLGLVSVPAAGEALPPHLQKEMRKEARKLTYRDVSVLDGQFTFRVPGKLQTSSPIDNGWYFESHIKANAPLECYLFDDNVDIAALMSTLSDINIDTKVEASGFHLAGKRISKIDAGHIEGSPYITLEWLFTLGDEENRRAGYTKTRIASVADVTLACSHNFFGYRETFARIFTDFVSAVRTQQPATPAVYEEIVVERVNGMNVGFSHVRHLQEGNGNIRIRTTRASMYPAGSDDISTSDSSSSTWSSPDGHVIVAYSTDRENGELLNDMRLRRDDHNNWSSVGLFQGKTISYVIDGEKTPVSELGQMRLLSSMLSSESRQARIRAWMPSIDPSDFVVGVVNETGKNGEATINLGAVEFDVVYDQRGSLLRASTAASSSNFELERIWVSGDR